MFRRWTLIVLAAMLVDGCASSTPSGSPEGTSSPSTSTSGAATPSGSASTVVDPASIGRAFIVALSRGDWAGAAAMEDPVMAAAAPAARLEQIAAQLTAQYGAFGSIGDLTTASDASGTAATVPVSFASATVTLEVSVNAAGQVTGLRVEAVATASAPPASYVDSESLTETTTAVGSAPWILPGTLTMPNGPGPFPAVVLVHGSGPNDRDETYGPNKAFRDLAWGLASDGIAVLRYDKRTFVYGAQMAADTGITVRQETTDDAIAAARLLRGNPKIDPARVFLVGHSLGAYLAPRIEAQVPGQLAGIAMLETPSTSVVRLILMQAEYLASPQGSPTPEAEQQLATLKTQVALAESPALTRSTPASELPLGVPASYWLDLRSYDPTSLARTLAIPMFFVQGGRDYQVPPSELIGWKNALAGHSDVTFRTYPAMNHQLFDGDGPATPAEYSMPARVDSQLVADLAAWIESH